VITSRHPPLCRVGIIGAGSIAEPYIKGLKAHSAFKVIAVSSASGRSAIDLASKHGLEAVATEAMLKRPDIDYVLNLTPASQHFDLNRRALLAGKHVYSEKPLAGSRLEARELIEIAAHRGVLLACAPATFLGPVWQSALEIIESGQLGRVVSGNATLVYPGPDLFHHNPEHLFEPLSGPLFDMGVYHLSTLVHLLGPVCDVQAMASTLNTERSIKAGPRTGQFFRVNCATQIIALLRFSAGPLGTLTFSFDGFGSQNPGVEIIGERASLALPQAGVFEGKAEISDELFEWREVDTCRERNDSGWVIGPVEAWRQHTKGHRSRIDGTIAEHTLSVMIAIKDAAIAKKQETIPAP